MKDYSEAYIRLSHILKKARYDKGLTQKDVANKMNCVQRTIQNWESDLCRIGFAEVFDFFETIGLSSAPYIHEYLNPNKPPYSKIKPDETELRRRLCKHIMYDVPISDVERLLYIVEGNHDVDSHILLQFALAHTVSEKRGRFQNANDVVFNYQVAEANKTIPIDAPMPDMNALINATVSVKKMY